MDGPGDGRSQQREPATMLASESPISMRETREEALEVTLLWLSRAILPITGILGVQSYLDGVSWQPAIAIALAALPVVCLRLLRRRLGFAWTAKALVAEIFLLALYTEVMFGVTAGAVLLNVSMILLCGLLFGHRTSLLALVACVGAIALAGTMHAVGLGGPDVSVFFDPRRPVVWVRYAVTLTMLGGAVTVGITATIRSLQRSVVDLHASLERERVERAKCEAAQHMLERHERLDLLAQLAGGMAHDFNNTLMVVMSGVELISGDRSASAMSRRVAEEVLSATKASAATVKRTLALGKQASNVAQDVDVAELVGWVQTAARHLLPASITLSVEVRSSASVRIDAARMQQALLNLCINARDAMPAGGVMTLGAEPREVALVPPGWAASAGPYVALSVGDSGTGIDPQNMARIFEPFFTTKPVDQGTGLGLPMVRAAVRDAGGFLELRSEVGAGTCFTLFLPRGQRAARGEPAEEPVVSLRRAL